MSTSMIVPIAFFAVAIIPILVALGWVFVNKRTQHRHVEAEKSATKPKRKHFKLTGGRHWPRRPPPRRAPPRPKPTSRRRKLRAWSSKPPRTAAKRRPPVIGSTSSGSAQTLWIRPRRHPRQRPSDRLLPAD